MPAYKTPRVYVEEIPAFPPSVNAVETSIPAFIGATQKAEKTATADLLMVPLCIHSMLEYEQYYGFAKPETAITVTVDTTNPVAPLANASLRTREPYLMHYALQHFFANGGGKCYIISVGDYNKPAETTSLLAGLSKATETPGITLLLIPDATSLSNGADYYNICKEALKQCADKKDRFALIDVWRSGEGLYAIDELRSHDLGNIHQLSFGAAYYPNLVSSYEYSYKESQVNIIGSSETSLNGTLEELAQKDTIAYAAAKRSISQLKVLLPPSPAIAGIYARVDNSRGVWKAPANEVVNDTLNPEVIINDDAQRELNVHVTGKSINAIRLFPGRGILVWGARTLAGNDNEWKYVPVRRYFIMIEESIRIALGPFAFEPNDATSWVKIKSMIINFLTQQWRSGALTGNKPEHAFFVNVGLGETMTALDILEGRIIVETGLAMVRPAEFIILRFVQSAGAA